MSYLLPQNVSVAYTSARGRRPPRPLPVHDGLSMGPGFHKLSADSHSYDGHDGIGSAIPTQHFPTFCFSHFSISSTVIPRTSKVLVNIFLVINIHLSLTLETLSSHRSPPSLSLRQIVGHRVLGWLGSLMTFISQHIHRTFLHTERS